MLIWVGGGGPELAIIVGWTCMNTLLIVFFFASVDMSLRMTIGLYIYTRVGFKGYTRFGTLMYHDCTVMD
jgi:hypothetical protein